MSQEKPTVFIVVDGKQNFIAEINLAKGEVVALDEFNVLYGTEDELWGETNDKSE